MLVQERLHNFFNNRKPKEMKKPRTVPITSRPVGTGSGEFHDANGAVGESHSVDSENAP